MRWLIKLFRRKPPAPSPLALAQERRRQAAAAYARAVERQDSRSIHWAHKAFVRAQNALLAAEREARTS